MNGLTGGAMNGLTGGITGGGVPGAGGMNGTAGSAMTMMYPKEYSIFVGDLAPETSNSDLVAVFRNPVLGLRNDRAPKFIRPFASCKSAKIMLDPVTGVSRGYGFVRFTDEADQQRALIEMHGLYCLSRPMRISPATAKFKPPQAELLPASASEPSTSSVYAASSSGSVYPASASGTSGYPGYPPNATPLPTSVSEPQQQSVSAPIATATATPPAGYYSADRNSQEYAYPTDRNTQEYFAQQQQHPQQYAPPPPPAPLPAPSAVSTQQADEWRHTAQARAILGNLIGPNGEQLTSTDPYNTTVFVGGLSPLVGEDTLRTFFVPFGEIHYVKVPVGKHCGFVQFVRKADAERAIEKMQGFPVGGSRIRLSWGRSQYKAAQAAAQAAQAAALAQVQAQTQTPPAVPAVQVPVVVSGNNNPNSNNVNTGNANGGGITPAMLEGMTHDQAVALLQKFQMQGFAAFPASAYPPPPLPSSSSNGYSAPAGGAGGYSAPASGGGGYSGANGSANGHGSPEAYRNGFHSSSSPSNSNDAYTANAAPHFTDESLKVRRGEEAPFGYPTRGAYEVPPPSAGVSATTTSSFSPFSPDPNLHVPQQQGQQHHQHHHQEQHGASGAGGLYAAAEMLGKRRDSYVGLQGLPHPSKAYAPGFFPVQTNTNGGAASKGMGMGSSSSPTYGSGGGGFSGSPPAFQVNRYHHPSQAQHQPISRPHSGSSSAARAGAGASVGQQQRGRSGEFGLDAMHDLNGTLASLDLEDRVG
ncbi:hypothetical protein B0H12DRAFT_43935, partial [Mycena haematopus]